MKRLAVALFLLVLTVACGGNGPTSPTPAQTTTTAALAVSAFTASVDTASTGLVYHVTLQMRETAGRSGVSVNSVIFRFPDGSSADASPSTPLKIAAGATSSTSTVTISDKSGAAPVSQLSVAIGFVDDSNHSGSVTASTSVTQPAPVQLVTIAGVVSDAGTHAAVAGASVTVTDSKGTQKTGSTDGNGYYSVPGIAAGSVTVRATASGYSAWSQTVNATGDTRVDAGLTKPSPDVEYRISGNARRCSATYENSTGGTSQSEVNVPFSYSWSGARSGDFLYMSCQIDTGGDNGSITIGLYIRGSLAQSATANGFPNIATVSGSYR